MSAVNPINLRSNKVDSLSTQSQNFHGRRITNASDAIDPQDYVTLAQLNAATANIQQNVDNSKTNINNSTIITGGAAVIDYHTVSGALAISASVMPAPTNGLLRVFLTMASGAVQPTWNASDFSLTPGEISITVGTRTLVCFCADGAGKWAMEAPPVTNR
jgi:hypothetical protein